MTCIITFTIFCISGGVYVEPLCKKYDTQDLHVMTAVGYGTTANGVDYWVS